MAKGPRTQLKFWISVGLLLALLTGFEIWSATKESQVWDEGFELGSGYAYLKTGRLRFNLEQPPLAKLLAALPLLYLNPRLPVEDPSWINKEDIGFGFAFMYHNRVSTDTMLMAARSSIILLTAALGFLMAVWTRCRFGVGPALLALALLAFDPNILAHGHYATTDLGATFFIFAACIAWDAFLSSRRKLHLALSGILLGFAVGTKFSAVMLLPAFAILYAIRWWQQNERFTLLHFAGSLLAVAAIAYVAIVAVYLPEAKSFVPSWAVKRPGPPLETAVNCTNTIGDLLCQTGRVVSLQANSFYRGLSNFAQHNAGGHLSYLLGQFSQYGWWYYFPVVFLVKTPTADLLLFGVLLVGAGLALFRNKFRINVQQVPIAWATILVPPLLYFGLSMASRIDLGVRHLLPFYPFFFIALAAGFFELVKSRPPWTGPLLILVCVLLAAESLSAFPDYLSFFNLVSGGTWRGPNYLLDSNIDWGEDLKKLRGYINAHPAPQYCLEYFGTAVPDYYGIEHTGYVARTNQPGERQNMDCMVAISATVLYDLYEAPGSFTWLRARKPVGRVGGIWIFDVRKPHD
ncbi:MAG TPA: phospholipid carrier-dependent glycosyltransferase [Bryobacteraceae bacterium]|nr:phospholipid carrier-dependent glycosyltransferase [Bryobacteraceae bacterium]